MFKKEMIAMILAGGQGSRLGIFTKNWQNLLSHLEGNIESLIFRLVTAQIQE